MKKLRRAFFLLLLAIALPLLISHWSIGGNSYIARNVGFRFSQAPKCIYSLDLVGHGKEFDLLKVYEISDKVGFDSAFYFSKVFKKLEGVSPREYMQRMKVSYVDAKDEATV